MKVKRFVGEDVREAMFKVRMELGADALILHTRKFKEGGFLGFFARQMVEVTAAIDDNPPPVNDRMVSALVRGTGGGTRPAEPAVVVPPAAAVAVAAAAEPEVQEELAEVKQLVNKIIGHLEEVKAEENLPEPLDNLKEVMLQNEVEEPLARQILTRMMAKHPDELHDQEKVGQIAEQVLGKLLKPIRPIQLSRKKRRIVALVGPTGVGKTTTIAKLAADFALLQGKNVALVTIDTYRIAAVDQLRTYSEIIRVPIDVVFTPKGLESALQKYEDYDLVLIDTAGRSPKNANHLSELGSFFPEDSPVETHLVLSATTRYQDLVEIVSEFEHSVRVDRLLFTKLDETSVYGAILNLVHRTKKPLSYITTGQNVPDDIEVADPVKLARAILGVNACE